MDNVVDLSGNEFAKGSVGLPDQVDAFFAKYNYSIVNPDIGDVEMNRRGAKDSIAHGIGRIKAASFAAVPYTIEKGKIIDYQKNWNGRQYDTIVLAAPISINGERYYQGVIVIRDVSTQRFYLHEVLTEKESDTSFKTGAGAKHTPGDVSPSLISLLKKVRDVNKNVSKDVVYSTKRDTDQKQKQLDIINETNPAPNTYSTWIRTVDDIKTLSETLEDDDWEYEVINPDLTRTDIQNAIESGEITVYSSYPIENGVFVSPSRMEAESYSGDGRVYEKTVDINDVA